MAYTVISGSTGGIGKAFAQSMAKSGNDLFLTGRSKEKLNALKTQLEQINSEIVIEIFPCQLLSESDRVEMFNYIDQKGITFNRLINVAGVDIQKGFSEYTTDKVIFQTRVNCESTVVITHEVLKRFTNGGEIITISSMSGVTPMPYFALYSATKSMLTNFFYSLRKELKERKIKVTTVLPGGVYTRPDICNDIKGQGLWGKLSAKTPEFVVKKSLKAVRKNKAKCIPGFFNKLLYFIMKITPLSLQTAFIKNRWKKQTKDAF